MNLQVDMPIDKINTFCKKWQITEFAVFGSVIREDFTPSSDIDVLVTFDENTSYTLFDLINMNYELEDIVGRKVDLLTRYSVENSENYIRKKHILENAQVLYAA